MADTAARLAAVHAALEKCVKEGCTFSSLDGPQHDLDAIDASRYHDGALPDQTHVAEIDACYGAGFWGGSGAGGRGGGAGWDGSAPRGRARPRVRPAARERVGAATTTRALAAP